VFSGAILNKYKKEEAKTEYDYLKELREKSSTGIDEYIKECAETDKKELDDFVKKT
jgi:hypothetical protein